MFVNIKTKLFSYHAGVIVGVFLLFVLNAIGVINFPLNLGSAIQVNTNPIGDLLNGADQSPGLFSPHGIGFLCVGVLLCVLLPLLDPIKASIVTFIAILPPFAIEYATPGQPHLIPMEYTMLMILVLFSVNVLINYFLDTHKKQKIISMFGQYVPPQIAEAISRTPEAFSLDGEARELTVLFCDIREFSAISERLDPRQLAQLLNLYFTEFTDILHRHNATIDKYMGDAIMAFWGAPLEQADHPSRALESGIAMLEALSGLNATFEKRGLPTIDIGIGINTGVMNVGNMGSRYRVAYTVVGDPVNLGARLEGLTRIYDTKIVVSETTMAANPDYVFRELDHVRVKGKGQATRIFEPVGRRASLDTNQKTSIKEHQQAIEAYYAGEWSIAERLFADLDSRQSGSRYYLVMRSRILELSARNDPKFDGITSFNAEMSIGTS